MQADKKDRAHKLAKGADGKYTLTLQQPQGTRGNFALLLNCGDWGAKDSVKGKCHSPAGSPTWSDRYVDVCVGDCTEQTVNICLGHGGAEGNCDDKGGYGCAAECWSKTPCTLPNDSKCGALPVGKKWKKDMGADKVCGATKDQCAAACWEGASATGIGWLVGKLGRRTEPRPALAFATLCVCGPS